VLGAEHIDVVQVYSEGKMEIADIMVVLATGSFSHCSSGLVYEYNKRKKRKRYNNFASSMLFLMHTKA
jgi:hypothetical protein